MTKALTLRTYLMGCVLFAGSMGTLSGCDDEVEIDVDAIDTSSDTNVDTLADVEDDAVDLVPLPEGVLPPGNNFARTRAERGTCAEEDYAQTPPSGSGSAVIPDEPFAKLSDYNFFWGEMSAMQPNVGVIPYTTASFLWADGTGKARFIVMPEGGTIGFDAEGQWTFPDGTIIVKNFLMPADERDPDCEFDPIETRLLIRRGDDWDPQTYIWNEDRTDADIHYIGETLRVNLINRDGVAEERPYGVPQRLECDTCHRVNDEATGFSENHLLAVSTAQLNTLVLRDGAYVNQLEWLAGEGAFNAELPDVETLLALANPMDEDADIDDRARSYFHANCFHCHQEGGVGGRSQLFLSAFETDDTRRGICKPPLAAGSGAGDREHDVIPGYPDASVIIFRMDSVEPQARMPELATMKIDDFGVELISDWITQLPEASCTIDHEANLSE